MNIFTLLCPSQALPTPRVDIAVIIDVIRATTVMTRAIASGATAITTTGQIDQALALAETMSPRPLLCGERDCKPLDGFDLGNSPSEYRPAIVRGRELILTTTNGTQAIGRHASASGMIAASFLNLTATVERIASSRAKVVHLVCAGTDGQVSGEDVLLAGAICHRLGALDMIAGGSSDGQAPIEVCDSSKLAMSSWRDVQAQASDPGHLLSRLSQSLGARKLLRQGLGGDLADCAKVDTASVIVTRVRNDPPLFARG